MTREEYEKLAAEFRSKAIVEESPAFRAELEDLARCYEWAAGAMCEARIADKSPADIDTR